MNILLNTQRPTHFHKLDRLEAYPTSQTSVFIMSIRGSNPDAFTIQTQRLGLRNWIESDIAPFVAMCQDEEVMKHFPELVSAENATNYVRSYQQHFEEHGFTYFAVEELSSGEFLGFVGLKHQTYESPFTPCVDIGWRLKTSAWGKGYATEAAEACFEFAFGTAKLSEVFSMCTNTNSASEAVMRKIGMGKVGTFTHPAIASESHLNPCLAYRGTADSIRAKEIISELEERPGASNE